MIPHKRVVKYLGVRLDNLLKFNQHVQAQITKETFNKLHRLFYSKLLSKRAKIISWLCLIRPILTYACPIWFNLSASYMEKLRLLERKVIRASLFKYRSERDGFMKKVSNYELLNEAAIPRIDCFIINPVRRYIKNSISHRKKLPYLWPSFSQTTLSGGKSEVGIHSPRNIHVP